MQQSKTLEIVIIFNDNNVVIELNRASLSIHVIILIHIYIFNVLNAYEYGRNKR